MRCAPRISPECKKEYRTGLSRRFSSITTIRGEHSAQSKSLTTSALRLHSASRLRSNQKYLRGHEVFVGSTVNCLPAPHKGSTHSWNSQTMSTGALGIDSRQRVALVSRAGAGQAFRSGTGVANCAIILALTPTHPARYQSKRPVSRGRRKSKCPAVRQSVVCPFRYLQRKIFSAAKKQTTSQPVMIAIWNESCAMGVPCSMLALSASITAVNGSARITGCSAAG